MLNPKPKIAPQPSPSTGRAPLQRIAKYLAFGGLTVGILFLLLILGAAWYGSGRVMYTSGTPHSIERSAAMMGLKFEDVTFTNERGLKLSGWFVPGNAAARAAVVTVHGAGGDRTHFLPTVPMLHDAGYSVLLFDCSHAGQSEGGARRITLGVDENRDVSAAVHYLKSERKFHRVGVLGCSQGGASVILAGARDPAIDAVIAEASFLTPREIISFSVHRVRPDLSAGFVRLMTDLTLFRMGAIGQPSPIDVVDRIAPRPLLLMQGSADQLVPVSDVAALYQRAREPKQLWVGEGANHCGLINQYPDRYRQEVVEFLKHNLPLQ